MVKTVFFNHQLQACHHKAMKKQKPCIFKEMVSFPTHPTKKIRLTNL